MQFLPSLIKRVALFCAAFLLLGSVAVAFLLATGPGRSITANLVNSIASNEDQQVEVVGLNSLLGNRLEVEKLSLSDSEGVWASAQNISIDYSFLDIFFGRVDVQKVSIEQFEIDRKPISSSSGPSQPFKWPESLLPAPLKTVSIDSIEVSSLNLGEKLAGQPATFTLGGALNATKEPLRTSGEIRLQQLAGGTGALDATWQIDPAAKSADLSLELKEGKNGVLAQLLNIPGGPAIDIRLAGSGPQSAWETELAVSFDGAQIVDGRATLSLIDDKQSIQAQLKGQLAPLLPKSILPLVAGNSDIVVSANRDGAGNIEIERATLTSALAQVDARGVFSPEQNRVDLRTELQIGSAGEIVEFTRQPGTVTRLGEVSLSTTLVGPVREATLQAQGQFASFEEGPLQLQGASFGIGSQQLDLIEMRGNISANAALESLVTGNENMDALLVGGLKIETAIGIADNIANISNFVATNDVITSKAAGQFSFVGGETSISSVNNINVAVDNLVGQIFGRKLATIIAELTIDDKGNINAQTLEIKSANLNANATGTLSTDRLSIQGELGLADISQFNSQLSGQLLINADVEGSSSNPNLSISIKGENVAVAGEPLAELAGAIDGTPFETLHGKLNAKYSETPISLSARTSADQDGVRKIDALTVSLPGTKIVGNLIISPAAVATGVADISVTDFSALAPLLLQTGLSGSANGKIVLSADEGRQNAAINLLAPSLVYNETSIADLQLNGRISDLFGELAPQIEMSARTIATAGQVLQNPSLSIAAENGNWPVKFDAQFNGSPLSVRAAVRQSSGKTTIDIEKALATYQNISIANQEPLGIIPSNGVVNVSAPSIRIDGATASVSGSISDRFDLIVDLADLSMSTVEKIANTGLAPAGQVSVQAKIAGPVTAPIVDFQIDGKNFSGAPLRDAKLAALDLGGAGRFENNIVRAQLKVSGGGLDVLVSGGANVKSQSLDLAAKGALPFAYVAQPLTSSGIVLSGSANLDATIGGSFASPDFRGQVSTSGARFTEIASRIRVTDLSGLLIFNGDTATISSLEGRLGENGSLSAKGSVSLRPSDKLQSDLTLNVRNGNYNDGVLLSADFDADLLLSGRLAETGLISGQVDLNRADITIPAALPNVVSPVAVSHKNASQAVNAQSKALQPKQAGGSGPSMALNIDVNAQNRIFVRGRGLDAELGGGLTIGGTAAQPTAKGAIRMSRGRMDILTKRFDFDTGQITFAGPLDPTLNFSATTRESGSSYSILVSGPASSPEFSFASSPSLPQDQIVAKLFFGRSLSDLSPLQLVQLAGAVNTLNGSGTDSGLAGRLRSIAGLDDVDIKTNEQGETTLGVGGYLNDRTYLNVEKGTGAGSGKVTIDLNITDNITARGETSEDGKTKAGVFFEQDY